MIDGLESIEALDTPKTFLVRSAISSGCPNNLRASSHRSDARSLKTVTEYLLAEGMKVFNNHMSCDIDACTPHFVTRCSVEADCGGHSQ
jgi:hypothetical protein